MLAGIDHGWFGLRPLKIHAVVCGLPRSGSTLLQLQIEACVSDVRVFGKETSALPTADWRLRNHSYMMTKHPFDVFCVDEIRAFYATRKAKPRFILTVRDPRAVLTSFHANRPGGYYVRPTDVLAYCEHIRYAQKLEDVLTVEYRDLVSQPAQVERRLMEFIGWRVHLPFEQFHTKASPDFDSKALNGVRPLDPSRVDSWRRDEHRARVQQVLHEIPGLPDLLIDMGYESDSSWTREYC
jgi:hypothetical protein